MIGTRAFDPLTSIILYIYSMETFLPGLIDNASWVKDEKRVDTLGPFVLALHEIVYRANNKRHDVMRGQFSVFRGMQLSNDIINQYIQMVNERESLALMGFTSTHKNRESAERNALSLASENNDPDTLPVLIEIVCRTSLRCFEMNRKEFSPYFKHDDEVLFLDGNCLKVLSVDQVEPSNFFTTKKQSKTTDEL